MRTTISFLGAAVLDEVLSKSLCFQMTQNTNPLPSHLQNDKNQCQTAFITGLLYYLTLRHALLPFFSSSLSVRYNLHQKGFCSPCCSCHPATQAACKPASTTVFHTSVLRKTCTSGGKKSWANTKPAIPPATQSPEHYRENKRVTGQGLDAVLAQESFDF